MVVTARPPVEADLDVLTLLDERYARGHGLERLVSAGSLRFFGRTEHSFVAESGSGSGSHLLGFVFAQAVWSGERPQVLMQRLATSDAGVDPDLAAVASASLVKALVKSAYDSGVYDLVTRVPATDVALRDLLRTEAFFEDEQVTYVRLLGSRGAQVAAAAEAATQVVADVGSDVEAVGRG